MSEKVGLTAAAPGARASPSPAVATCVTACQHQLCREHRCGTGVLLPKATLAIEAVALVG